ncbi:MAG: hypothetical protein NVSMB22_27170 [Chloroflexota bacterium]
MVLTAPHARVNVRVTFPNGDSRHTSRVASTGGHLTYVYTQPGSRITRTNRRARVFVTASDGSTTRKKRVAFTINFAVLDVSAQPRSQHAGQAVGIWVHSAPRTRFSLSLQPERKQLFAYPVSVQSTAADGWGYVRLVVPAKASRGTVHVKATGAARGARGETSFRIT